MAFMPYFAIGPTSILGLIGLIYWPDKTVPTPAEDWKQATVDLVIPSYNEAIINRLMLVFLAFNFPLIGSGGNTVGRGISNAYREELYLFLQGFI